MAAVNYLKLLGIGIPLSLLFFGSAVLFFKQKSLSSLLQLIGAGGLMLVLLAHVAEALRVLPSMGWGFPDSAGHYLDLAGASLGLILFPTGYLFDSLGDSRRARARSASSTF